MGDFIVAPGVDAAAVRAIAEESGVDFRPLASGPGSAAFPISQQRIGVFQRHYGGNMDEGWTRLLLESFDFPYTTVMDEVILRGALHERWDVILLPNDSRNMMVEGGGDPSSVPPGYRSGFGEAGIAALDAFVENGGTLVTMSQAGQFALADLDVPVRDAVAGVWGNDFWAPGASLRVNIDNTTPFTWGMPARGLATFLAGGQVYETESGARSADVQRLVTYRDRDILESGWLLNEEAIANKAAIVAVSKGQGTVLMLGFRVQHRAQTHGTYKLLFNALMEHPGEGGEVAAGG